MKYQQAKINIYGSSNNGFGTDGSDIDLCLIDFSIDKEKIFEIADEIVAILESIHMNDIDKSRLHARIPVIRFEDPITKLQCDLCFNNILPIRNTRKYTTDRVSPLRKRQEGYLTQTVFTMWV